MAAAIQWTPELEDAICAAIAVTPKGLEHICKANPEFPCADKIYEHRRESKEFGEKYAHAKSDQVLILAEQIIDIADDSSRDTINTDDGPRLDREHVERVKIRIDSRKWLASKLAPKIFGEKLGLAGADGDGPLEVVVKHIGGGQS
jgi:hypothetical protein